MSIAVMTDVWRRSQHSGSHLLMMLALADFSDDGGNCYPAVSTLAAKCRMKPRNANVVLAALRDSGELQIKLNEGPKGTNRYRIVLSALGVVQGFAGVQANAGVQSAAGAASACTLQGNAVTPARACSKPLQRVADEPSLNRQEPSDRSPARPAGAKAPACPIDAIVDLYHSKLPELPRVRLMQGGREKALRKLWAWVLSSSKADGSRRATTAEQALAWVGDYFERASANDFLMGRGTRSEAHANWRCDLDFLLTDRGMRHVIEKTEVAA